MSKYQCGFGNIYSAHQFPIFVIEKLWNILDKVVITAVLLTDLCETFLCLPPSLNCETACVSDWIIVYKTSILPYPTKTKNPIEQQLQLVVRMFFLSCTRIHPPVFIIFLELHKDLSLGLYYFFGVAQGSALGSLLFSMFLCASFLWISNPDMASYADDNTSYFTAQNPKKTRKTLLV